MAGQARTLDTLVVHYGTRLLEASSPCAGDQQPRPLQAYYPPYQESLVVIAWIGIVVADSHGRGGLELLECRTRGVNVIGFLTFWEAGAGRSN